MEKITKSELKQIISEEVARFKQVKSLEEKKRILEEAIKKMEEGEELDEISWKGVKSALGFAGDKAASAATGAAEKVGGAVSSTLQKAQAKFKTGLATLDKGVKDFGAELSKAATKGDVEDLNEKITKLLDNVIVMFLELNKKEEKIGLPTTNIQSVLMSSVGKAKKMAKVVK
jgi:hypothetical protein